MSSQPKTVTTTQTKELPDEFKGLLGQYVDQLGQTSVATAPLLAGQQQVLASLGAAGNQATTQVNDALGMLRKTAEGNYVGANPYLDAQVAKAQQDIGDQFRTATAPTIDASAARAGIFGGSAWGQQQERAQKVLANELSNVDTQTRGQAYQTERSQQEAAVLNMLDAGDAGVKLQQSLFGAYEPFRLADQANMDEGQRKLALLNQAIELGYSGASTASKQPNPSYVSPFQQLLGVGLMGAGLMTGNPTMVGSSKGLI